MLVAGGTDLYPKLKRRQMEPDTLVGLTHLRELHGLYRGNDGGLELGALVTLAAAARAPDDPQAPSMAAA